jgi:L-histidine Nalpha-methyltransferase
MSELHTAGSRSTARAADAAAAQFAADVQYYLMQDPRQLPSRYLYDPLGSALFEAICRLPWYTITRAESRLLAVHGGELFQHLDALSSIVELGPGSGEKLHALLDVRGDRRALTVHLVDVSAAALVTSVRLLEPLPRVRVVAHAASYESGLAEAVRVDQGGGRTLVLFLGSNIGNFDPPNAAALLRTIRGRLVRGDALLLGADLVKAERDLLLAYDDPLGVTAAFNRNLLVRINRELGGNFDLERFAHRALWNAGESRVEMHLVARCAQRVRVAASQIDFTMAADEGIWTESSYKYHPDAVVSVLQDAGFRRLAQWIDDGDGFALTLVEAV